MKKRIASAILTLCLLLPLLPVSARAEEGDAPASGQWGENLTWRYDGAENILTVSGTGTMGSKPSEVDVYKDKALKIVIEDGITTIEQSAFEGWSALTNVSLPASVIVIGDNAFNQCIKLTQADIPNRVRYIGSYAFAETKIREVVIPDDVLEINSYAFSKCKTLEKVTVSQNLIKIGNEAFQFCSSLASVEGLEYVKSIGEYAFDWCDALKSIELCQGAVLSERAFFRCGLTHLTIPAGCIVESNGIFASCTELVDVEIEEGVSSLGNGLFANCTKLKTVRIPESVARIGNDLVTSCPSLSKIYCTADAQWQAKGLNRYKLAEYDFPSNKEVEDQEYISEGKTHTAKFVTYWWYDTKRDILNLSISSSEVRYDTMAYRIEQGKNHPWQIHVKSSTRVVISGNNPVYVKTADVFPDGMQIYSIGEKGVTAAPDANVNIHLMQPILKEAATCSQSGSTLGYRCWTHGPDGSAPGACDFPEQLKPKSILPIPHTIEDIPEVPPTSTTSGTAFGKRCSVCGETLLEPIEIPPTGSNPNPAGFTVIFDLNYTGATGTPASQIVQEGGKVPKPDNPTRTSYNFEGWYKEADCKTPWDFDNDMVEGDITLYAKWTADTSSGYTITFKIIDENGVRVFATRKTGANGKLTELPTPDDPKNYGFNGWYTDTNDSGVKVDTNTVFTEDTNVFALWNNVYIVEFYKNARPYDMIIQMVQHGEKAKEPDTPKHEDGYPFVGWYTLKKTGNWNEETWDEKWNFDNPVNKNLFLCAKWDKSGTTDPGNTKEEFTVTFNSNGGSTVDAQTIEKDGKVAKPANPTKSNSEFVSWCKDEKLTDVWDFDSDTVTSNITLYAKWKEATAPDKPTNPDNPKPDTTYTIQFNLNYTGAAAATSKTTDKDGKLADWPADPTRAGYKFDGWFTAASGGEKAPSTFSKDTTLYAHWTATPTTPTETYYRIYIDSTSGGNVYPSHDSAPAGTRITIDPAPRSGYMLDWITVTNRTTGREVNDLRERSNGEYTFTMPASSVDVEVSFVSRYARNVYFDFVPPTAKPGPTAWYYMNRHIYHVTNGQVPDGTSITRDMLISVLYNLTDESLLATPSTIGSETNNSHAWAVSNNITPDIYASGLWGTDKALSREQLSMMVFQYAAYRGYGTFQSAAISHYSDYGRVRPIARSALSWALATGLMSSTSNATLSPQAGITCGQTGELLYRFLTTIA